MTENESWQNVGRRIRFLRKENNLTIQQLSAGCGLSANAIGLVERGKVAPSILTLCKIAHALGVSASSLFHEICASEVILTRAQESHNERLPEIAREVFSGKSADCELVEQQTQMFLCLQGPIDCEVNEQSFRLNPGDSLTFTGNAEHRWNAPDKEVGIVVMVLTPRKNCQG